MQEIGTGTGTGFAGLIPKADVMPVLPEFKAVVVGAVTASRTPTTRGLPVAPTQINSKLRKAPKKSSSMKKPKKPKNSDDDGGDKW